ncbi:chemotaxis protein CheW [Aeromonas jandaei]|uniref:chemotaxis protein CheW n=1 Tax=Aeromonas jandaei TaxID=650 RepID=UPI001933C14D|nr:chemotaxis protein CheW [Aeromonas jandaei]MBM0490526.1 chemotaxis protein CheW [Aeromonas jandaei]MBM0569174.1 chemotaxis protein CheW [Aeromonas jandaei]
MRTTHAPDTVTSHFHCVTFMLGGELYGVDIGCIREIIEFEGMTPVPMMPCFVRGIINLRGAVVPVIDLSIRFGRGQTPIQPTTCVAILSLPNSNGEEQEIGMLLDSVCEVLEIATDTIEPAPTFGAHIRGDFIQGVVTIAQQFAILLDMHKALSIAELSAMAEATTNQLFNSEQGGY